VVYFKVLAVVVEGKLCPVLFGERYKPGVVRLDEVNEGVFLLLYRSTYGPDKCSDAFASRFVEVIAQNLETSPGGCTESWDGIQGVCVLQAYILIQFRPGVTARG